MPREKVAEFYRTLDEARNHLRTNPTCRCMFSPSVCQEPPIVSHLLAESWLRMICDEMNKVVKFELDTHSLDRHNASVQARKVGVAEKTAVTFPGFCRKHDSELFACIENAEFAATSRQLLALSYRSVCRELCTKQQLAAPDLPKALTGNMHPELQQMTLHEAKNCFRLFARKEQLERGFAGQTNDLNGFVVQFASRPEFLASSTFSFPETFSGKRLEARFDWITLSIVPTASGGFAVFTWSKRAPKNSSLLVKSFAKIPRDLQSSALMNLILHVSESFALSPKWWAGITEAQREALLRRFSWSFVRKNPSPPTGSLFPKRPPLVDWKIINTGFV